MVEVHRARQRIRRGLFLEDADLPPALREQDREQLPDRAIADDRDVAVERAGHDQPCAPVMSAARSSGERKDAGTGGPQL